MRLSKLYECCTLYSCDPVYLLEVCRRFGWTYCPLFKADDWQSKTEAVGDLETSIFVRCDIPKDGVLHSVYNSRLDFCGCPVLLPIAWRILCFCILYTVYVVLYTLYCVCCTVYCILCTLYCNPYAEYVVLYTVCCVRCTEYCIVCTLYWILYSVYVVLYTVYCVRCTVHCILCTLYCTL
jgi:hypothetical protein